MSESIDVLTKPGASRMRVRLLHLAWWWHTQSHDRIKRCIDVLAAGLALLSLMPLLLLLAAAIKLGDGGPVLFWQRRVGLHGRLFAFPKFRSMRVDAEPLRAALVAANQHGAQGVTFKMKDDPRITRLGKWIRRTSIDELPQLWCVLVGDMSLVGPRPPIVSEVARYTSGDRLRLSVKPGLTCIWQVSGRAEIPFPQQVNMDIDYIRQQSTITDLRLIASTLPAVIRGRGAY